MRVDNNDINNKKNMGQSRLFLDSLQELSALENLTVAL